MINWFPLCKSMMEENKEFRKLTPAEKLYYWLLISEYNRHGGEFYKSDLEIAVTLGLSEVKIRQARRKITALYWLKVKPGFKSQNKSVATKYLSVNWGVPEEGDFFAQIHRYAFEAMLAKVRHHQLTHADVTIYIYLAYLFWKNRGKDDGRFYITKNQLRELSNIPNAPSQVERLYQFFTFAGGEHLFEYRDQYHRLLFSKWNKFADPSENDNNRKMAEGYRDEIKKAVAEVKKKKQQALQTLEPEDLPEFYCRMYGGGYSLGRNQRTKLIEFARQYGVKTLQKDILKFMADTVPHKTFPFFLEWFEKKRMVK